MIIDFALQEEGGTLNGAFEEWTNKAQGKAVIDYGFHVAITDLARRHKDRAAEHRREGRGFRQDLHGVQGHPALHRGRRPLRGPATVAKMPASSSSSTPRTGTRSPSCRSRRSRAGTRPRASTRSPAPSRSRPRRRTARSAWPRSPEPPSSSSTSRALPPWRRSTSPTSVARPSSPRPARSTSPSPTTTSPARASRAPSTSARRRYGTSPTARRCGTA